MAKKKKYDREPVNWITINGHHVPVFEGESTSDAARRYVEDLREDKIAKKSELYDKGKELDKKRMLAESEVVKDKTKAQEDFQTAFNEYDKAATDYQEAEKRFEDASSFEAELEEYSDPEYKNVTKGVKTDKQLVGKEALTNKLKELSDDELKERNSNIVRAANDGIPNIKGQREAYEEEIKRRGIELDTSYNYKKNWTKEDALKEVESQLQFHYEHKELTEGDNPVMLSKDGRYSVARNWDEADSAMKKYGWKYEPIDSKVASEIGERARTNAAKTLGIPYESKLKVGDKEVSVKKETNTSQKESEARRKSAADDTRSRKQYMDNIKSGKGTLEDYSNLNYTQESKLTLGQLKQIADNAGIEILPFYTKDDIKRALYRASKR